MKKRASIFMIFLILMQSIVSGIAPLSTAFAEGDKKSDFFDFENITDDSYSWEEDRYFLDLDWSLEDYELEEINEEISFDAPVKLVNQEGILTSEENEAKEIASFKTTQEQIMVTFNETALEYAGAKGTLKLEILSEEQDDEVTEEAAEQEETVAEEANGAENALTDEEEPIEEAAEEENAETEKAEEAADQENTEEEPAKEAEESENAPTDEKAVEEKQAEEDDKSAIGVMNTGGTAITENLIKNVKVWSNPDNEGRPTEDSEELQTIRPGTNEAVSLEFQWELPEGHEYHAGDYFTFTLPDKFLEGLELTGFLQFDGTVVGEYIVTPNGEVTFIFNEEINDGQGFEGDFFIWKQFDESKWEGETKQELVFDFGSESVSIPIHFDKNNDETIKKNGQPQKDGSNNSRNSDRIEWVVDFNLGEENVTGAVFEDTLPNGVTFDDASVKIYELTVNLDGSVEQGSEVTRSWEVNGDEFSIDFGNIEKAYRVVYETEVPAPSGDSPNYHPSYQNRVVVTGNNGNFNQNDNANVSIEFNEPLNKMVNDYEAETQEIQWKIDFNFNQQPVTERLIDTFDTGTQALVSDSFEVYEVTIDANGNATNPVLVDDENYHVIPTANGFDLEFTNADNKAYQIYYKTKAIDRVHEDQIWVENEVKIGENGESKSDGQNIGQVIFDKSNGSIDYANKTISWRLVLNRDAVEMENVVIEDDFANQGLTLNPDSLRINGNPIDTEQLTANPTYEEGFRLELGDIDDVYVITYITEFDPTYFDNTGSTPGYRNNATLDWDNKPSGTPDMNKTGAVSPVDYMRNNGDKRASYNAQTKEITWTIDMNFNRHTINQAIVRDFYTGEQTFVNGSLEIHELSINEGSGGTVTPGEAFTNFSLDTSVTKDGNDGFELTFHEPIDKPYRITYKTSLEGLPVLKEYTNNATLVDGDEPNKTLFDKTANVSPNHGNEYANKTVRQGTGADQTTAFWTLNINRGQSYIEKAVITDTLSPNQTYYRDSFKLYETNVESNGNITKGTEVDPDKYTLEISIDEDTWQESFELTFHEPIEKAYILEYNAFINANNGDTISNEASVAGHEVSNATDSSHQDHTASFQGGAGGSVYAVGGGKLEIQKVDADDAAMELAGAVFEVYDETGTRLLETITTGEDGVASTSKKYKYGKYMIKEVTAPDAYVINSEYADGKVVIFDEDGIYAIDQDGNKEEDTYTFTNQLGIWEFELTKVDEDNQDIVLAGAVFKLQEEDTAGNFVDVDPQPAQEILTTDNDGKIHLTLDHVEIGKNYRLVETQAPTGYTLDEANPSTVDFTIAENQTVLATATLQNTAVTGSVILTKVDDVDGTLLEGAVFNLEYNEGGTGNWVVHSSGYTTNEDGEIEVSDLKGGQYRFVEQTAPAGYQLDATPIVFTIEDGELEVEVEAENGLIKGSVELTKRGEDDNFLEGVIFELQDQEGNVIQTDLATDENGKILVEDLRPGLYQFVEKKSIPGYEKSDHVEQFEIIRGQTETLEIAFTNDLTPGTVRLTKVGEANEVLEGAVFSLLDENGDVLQENLTTNEDGFFDLALKPGKYQLVETTAPFGHELDDTPIKFEVAFNQDQTVGTLSLTKANERMTSGVKLTKTGEGGDLLEGVTFNLEDAEGNVVREGLTTDEDGIIIADGLKPGSYQLVETETIAGYELLEEPIPFEIELGQDSFTEVDAVNDFTTGSVRLVKVGEENEALAGAVFMLLDEESTEVATDLETNEKGIIEVHDLKPGTYYFVETKAPFGHDKDAAPVEVVVDFNQQEIVEVTMVNERSTSGVELTKTGEDGNLLEGVTFNLEDAEGNVVREGLKTNEKGIIREDGLKPGTYYFKETESIPGYDLLTESVAFEIELGQTEFTSVEAVNDLTAGSVRLIKVGEEEEALKGAVFTLYNKADEVIASGLETDEGGIVEVHNLKPGTYYFVETQAPFGHDADTSPVEVVVDFNQQETAVVTKVNERTTSGVELTKVDNETKETLSGATFELQDAAGNRISEHTTDEAGKMVVEDLKPGNYQFVEIAAPEGYELDATPILFTIALGQTANLQLTTDNQIIKGGFVLTKVDFDEGFALEGVEFELQDADGEEIKSGLKTDEEGKIKVGDLRPGDYQLVETKALAGYNLLKEPVAFSIHLGQLTDVEMEITNTLTRGSVVLNKTDEAGNTLANAVFILQTEDGETIASDLVTDEKGKIEIDNLKPGSYQFVEIKAPAGYQLDETPISFEIEKAQGETLIVTAINKKIKESEQPVKPDDLNGPDSGADGKTTASAAGKDDTAGKENGKGSILPKTATSIFTFLFISFGLLAAGLTLVTLNRRRNRSSDSK